MTAIWQTLATKRFGVAVIVLAAVLLAPAPAFADQLIRQTLNWEGKMREYFVHLPDQTNPSELLPVVLVLHGGGARSGGGLAETYGFKRYVDIGQMIAVYPTALGGAWAIGGAPTANPRIRPHHNDAGFLDAVLSAVIAAYPIDTARLFVTGASRGGFMTQWYVPRSRYRFAGAGTVIASMFRNIAEEFALKTPISWVMMIGDSNPFMPYEGRQAKGRHDDLLAVEEISDLLNRANGTDMAEPVISSLGDPDAWRRCGNEVSTWHNPETGARTVLVTVFGGSHIMFGSWQCKDFNHAEEMWRWFSEATPQPQ